jgi:hypothetical protein
MPVKIFALRATSKRYPRSKRSRRQPVRFHPQLVQLEDRSLPNTTPHGFPLPGHIAPLPNHQLPSKSQFALANRSTVITMSSQVLKGAVYTPPQSTVTTSLPGTVTPGKGFNGIGLQTEYNQNSGFIPPDTMGAVGPNHFVELINGQFAVYSKAGTLITSTSLDSFWSGTTPVGGTTGGTSDPHIVYDRSSGHWIASTININDGISRNDLLIGVSTTSDPTKAWIEYAVLAGSSTEFADYDTLGVDSNGVYFGANMFPTNAALLPHAAIFATAKGPLIAGKGGTLFEFDGITDMEASPQPAYNFDTVSATGPAWFVASSATLYANIELRTLTWNGATPNLSKVATTLATPFYGDVLAVPTSGGSVPIDGGDDRLLMAVIRNQQLWTSRTVGLGDRDAAEFLDLKLSGASATLLQSGRAIDTAKTDPRYYFYPSVMVNSQGYMVMGFSGAKITEFAGAYATSRLSTDKPGTLQPVTLLKGGQGAYALSDQIGRNRWGDFSYTSLDPADDKTIWTIQEYAATPLFPGFGNLGSLWGTWITSIAAPNASTTASAALSSASPSMVNQGFILASPAGDASAAGSSPAPSSAGADGGLLAYAGRSAVPGSASVDHFFASAGSAHTGTLATRPKSPAADPLDNWVENIF